MNQVIDMPQNSTDFVIHPRDRLVLAHITLNNKRIAQLIENVAHEPANRPALNRQRYAGATVIQILGNGPSNRMLVEHAGDQGGLAGEVEKVVDIALRITHKIVLTQIARGADMSAQGGGSRSLNRRDRKITG